MFSRIIEYGMYFYGYSDEIYEAFKDEPLYLGAVTANGSEYDSGKANANAKTLTDLADSGSMENVLSK